MLQIYKNNNFFSPVTQTVVAGIDTRSFNNVYAKQKQPNLCWAANLEMATRYYGVPVSQDYFARNYCGVNMWGHAKDCPAPVEIITENLNRCFKTHCLKAEFNRGTPDVNTLFNLLRENKPVILAYNPGRPIGHVVMLTGISYDEGILSNDLRSVVVRDPDPDILNQLRYGKKEYIGQQGWNFLNSVHSWWIPQVWKYNFPLLAS